MTSTRRSKPVFSIAARGLRSICLSLCLVAFTGCGFVLTPIEIVTAGTLSAIVKEISNTATDEIQTATEAKDEQDFPPAQELPESIPPDSMPFAAPTRPIQTQDSEITRISLMPAQPMISDLLHER